MTFKQLLKQLRIHRDITQEALAERLGITQATVNQTENGRANPQEATIRRYAKALGYDVELAFRDSETGELVTQEHIGDLAEAEKLAEETIDWESQPWGEFTDQELADDLGVTRGWVTTKRRELGHEAVATKRPESPIDWAAELATGESDGQIAQHLGVSRQAVWQKRQISLGRVFKRSKKKRGKK